MSPTRDKFDHLSDTPKPVLARNGTGRKIRGNTQEVGGSSPSPVNAFSGPVAQLGEHLFCTQGVKGSSPFRSTTERTTMSLKRLFNDPYLAYSGDAGALDNAVRASLEAFHRAHPDLDLRDCATVAAGAVHTYYAERVILRASQIRHMADDPSMGPCMGCGRLGSDCELHHSSCECDDRDCKRVICDSCRAGGKLWVWLSGDTEDDSREVSRECYNRMVEAGVLEKWPPSNG